MATLGVAGTGGGTKASSSPPALADLDPRSSIDDIARQVIEAPRVSGGFLSRDNSWVLYVLRRPSLATNTVAVELVAQQLQDGVPIGEPMTIERVLRPHGDHDFLEQWCPDGNSFSFMAASRGEGGSRTLMRYDIRARRATPIPIRDEMPSSSNGAGNRPRITTLGADYRWSPSGKWIGFKAPIARGGRLTPERGVRVDSEILNKDLSFATSSSDGLFILDVATGQLQQVSPDTLNVAAFAWAPNEESFAIETTAGRDEIPSDRSEIFVLDRVTRAVRPLVTRPGMDRAPVWSPDGRWIAFTSAFGRPGLGQTRLGIVPAAGGAAIELTPDDDQNPLPVFGVVAWTSDSRGFYFRSHSHMSFQLHRVDVTTHRITALPLDTEAAVERFSVGPDRRWQVQVRSTPTRPPELYLQGLPDGPLKQVTHLSDGFPLTSLVDATRVEWPSPDRRFTIEGMLLTLRRDSQGSAASIPNAARLPTIVYLTGGPDMYTARYSEMEEVGLLALAARGYAILIPNTRGRNGFGQEFRREIWNTGSYGRLPFEDMMGGVDYLVAKGIADPSRLGVWGHSYGGYLATYSTTQTHRFKAAVNHEGGPGIYIDNLMRILPFTDRDSLSGGPGIRNPFIPEVIDRLLAESSSFNMHCVSTPILILMGERGSFKVDSGKTTYSALRRFGVPVDLILYDERHVFTRPSSQMDYASRLSAWFDYWILDKLYPEPELAQQYDHWRARTPWKGNVSTRCGESAAKLVKRLKP